MALYLLPLLVLMVLTSDRSSPLVEQIMEFYEDDQLIITGTGNHSQHNYWERPDQKRDRALARGEADGVPLKTILFWNGIFYYPDFAFGRGRQPFIDAKCPVNTCLATDDPYLLPSVGMSLKHQHVTVHSFVVEMITSNFILLLRLALDVLNLISIILCKFNNYYIDYNCRNIFFLI